MFDVSRVIVADSKKVVEPGVRDGAVAAKPAGGQEALSSGGRDPWGNSDAKGVRETLRVENLGLSNARPTRVREQSSVAGDAAQMHSRKSLPQNPAGRRHWSENYYASDSLLRGLCFGT